MIRFRRARPSPETVSSPGIAPSGAAGFDAFVSYSHNLDRPIAQALQTGLHRFAKPWYRLRAASVP